ncbi:MAG: alpha/beta hydrolase [Fibrobacteres bacterium]|nr:alpha/beta hydrolase [Fibrobacterota bacterium]
MTGTASGQTAEPLWPKGAPGATDTTAASKPSLTFYPTSVNPSTGTSAVICPGGGYDHLATDKEGIQVAKWLNGLGVSAFVLKYRVTPYHHPIEMNDAKRAMRWARANAKRYKIQPDRIGIVGFSAGGHLASTVATHYDAGNPLAADSVDRQSCKPWFQILGYPVITMEGPFAHIGSRKSLLGDNPSVEDMRFLSNEKHVDVSTPPAFLVHAKDDGTVLVDNSIIYYDSLVKAGVPAQMKLYDHGPHGFGLANGAAGAPDLPELATWPGLCAAWMKERGFLTASLGIRGPKGSGIPDGAGRALIWEDPFDLLGRLRRGPARSPFVPKPAVSAQAGSISSAPAGAAASPE